MTFYDPKLCYILDCFLGLYGLVITGMFIKEKVGQSKHTLFIFPVRFLLFWKDLLLSAL